MSPSRIVRRCLCGRAHTTEKNFDLMNREIYYARVEARPKHIHTSAFKIGRTDPKIIQDGQLNIKNIKSTAAMLRLEINLIFVFGIAQMNTTLSQNLILNIQMTSRE